jgi:hypothetical protein
MTKARLPKKAGKPAVADYKHPHGARAFVFDGADGLQAAGVDNLRVLITKEDDVWLAQGLEIDYAIDGESLQDVKKRFEDGLAMTIESNLRVYDSITPLLQIAPQEVWDAWNNAKNALRRFEHSNIVVTPKRQADLPFDGIAWLDASTKDEAA